jgi:hypothetical protein
MSRYGLDFFRQRHASEQVHREVDRAFGKGKAVLPLRIEDIKPADELAYYLDTVHWLDAITPPLERNLEKLVATVQALLPTTELVSLSDDSVIDDAREAQVQDEARAEDERRLKEADAAQRTETAQREHEAAEALRQKQDAARRRAEEKRQREEDAKRRAEAEEPRRREETEAKQRAGQEQAFGRAKRADTVAALDAFIASYPASHLIAEAKALSATLAERDEAYKAAMASGDAGALNAFLERYPQGKPAGDVRKRQRGLEQPRSWRRDLLVGGGLGAAAISIAAAALLPAALRQSAPQPALRQSAPQPAPRQSAPQPTITQSSSALNFDLPFACLSYQPTNPATTKSLVFLVADASRYQEAAQQARRLGDQYGWSTLASIVYPLGHTDFLPYVTTNKGHEREGNNSLWSLLIRVEGSSRATRCVLIPLRAAHFPVVAD